jgi:small subunit ribosomal protein S17
MSADEIHNEGAGAAEADTAADETGKRKTRVGVVTSAKMQKTVVVTVERRVRHAVYDKYITRRKKYYAHDEKGECKAGDRVLLEETRPLSRSKRWLVKQVLERGSAQA